MKSHNQSSIHRLLNRIVRHRLLTHRRYRHIREDIIYFLEEWRAGLWHSLSCPLFDLSAEYGYANLLANDRWFRLKLMIIDHQVFDSPKSDRSSRLNDYRLYVLSDLSVLSDLLYY